MKTEALKTECLVLVFLIVAFMPSLATSATSCPGPAICGESCSLDPFGTPIDCSNGQCECAPRI